MKNSSSLSIYERVFQVLLYLYPRHHREAYGSLMMQLLHDRLHDAAKVRDPQAAREVFFSALIELPSSLIKEHLTNTLSLSVSNWKVFNYFFFTAIGGLIVSFLYMTGLNSVPSVIGALALGLFISLIVATFSYTRRMFLSSLVFLLGLAVWVVGFYIFTVFFDSTNSVIAWFAGCFIVIILPLLSSYALLTYYYLHLDRYRNAALSGLNDEQIRLLRAKIIRHRRIGWGIVTGVIVIFSILNIIGSYDPPRQNSQMELMTISLPENQNGYYDLAKIAFNPTNGFGDLNPDLTDWHDTKNQEKVQSTKTDQQHFIDASNKPYYQDARTASTAAVKSSLLYGDQMNISFGSTANALLIYSSELRDTGHAHEALQKILSVARMGDHILQGQNDLLQYLAATEVRSNALTFLEDIIRKNKLDVADLHQAQTELDSFHETGSGLASAIKVENAYHIAGLDSISTFMPISVFPPVKFLPYLFQPNRTAALMSDKQLLDVKQSSQPCATIPLTEYYPSQGGESAYRLRDLGLNGAGKWLANMTYYPVTSTQTLRCLDDFHLEAVRIMIVAALYQGSHNQAAQSLADLQLKKAPIDPFTGETITVDWKARRISMQDNPAIEEMLNSQRARILSIAF